MTNTEVLPRAEVGGEEVGGFSKLVHDLEDRMRVEIGPLGKATEGMEDALWLLGQVEIVFPDEMTDGELDELKLAVVTHDRPSHLILNDTRVLLYPQGAHTTGLYGAPRTEPLADLSFREVWGRIQAMGAAGETEELVDYMSRIDVSLCTLAVTVAKIDFLLSKENIAYLDKKNVPYLMRCREEAMESVRSIAKATRVERVNMSLGKGRGLEIGMYPRYPILTATMVTGAMVLAACGLVPNGGLATPTTRPSETPTTPPIVETEPVEKPTATETLQPTSTAEVPPTPMPTEAFTKVRHPEFSSKYQPEYIEHHVVVVEGITMNIDFGLSYWVTARPEESVSEIHIAPDIAQMVGELFLKSCWYRFTHFMPGNESVSYGQYVELVRQGRGNISFVAYDEVNGGRWPVETSFDPADGFALSLVDESLPIKMNDLWDTYFGTNATGRLLIANKLDEAMLSRYSDLGYEDKWLTIFRDLLSDAFYGILSVENKCFLYANVQGACGYPSMPTNTWGEFFKKIMNEMWSQHNGDRGPIFWGVEK